ncbi:MAG: 50S ribosomal protein L25/general stress protein Ctc [Firmicutes bacterium]|nr:50S ribosomal protein L25/general stress protein Ctc [Bacillota bacterium]
MGQFQLAARRREATGKGANRQLRRSGFIPGVVYGSGEENLNLQVDIRLLDKLLREGGAGRLVTLDVEGESKAVLVQELQEHPVLGTPVHVDFLEVRLDQAVSVMVPIQLIGEADRVQDGGVVAPVLWEVEVSCLPMNIPESLEIDISSLTVGDSLQIKDLEGLPGITVLAEPDETVVSIVQPMELEEEVDEDEIEDEEDIDVEEAEMETEETEEADE